MDSEEKFKSFFENNKAVMLQIDYLSKQIIDANDAAINYYGYSKENILKKNINELNTLPEHEINNKMQKAIKEKSNHYIFKHKIANGNIRDVEVYASPIKDKNSKSIFTIIHDVTDRIKSERNLKASIKRQKKILDAFDDGTYLSSSDYKILYLNPSMEKKIGKHALGEHCYKAIYGNDEICSWCYFEKLKEKKEGKIITEIKRKNKYYLVNSILLKDNSKLTVYHDITKQKIAEQELISAKEIAEENSRLKTEFLNNMSHEIRTPLNGILGFTGLLENSYLSEKKRKEFTGIVNDCGNRLLRIIDDILEISALETNKSTVYIESICLNNLLTDLFSLYDDKAAENKTPLYLLKGLSDEESTIYTDEIKLNKALVQLLENALKYTNTGYIEFGYILKNNNIELFVKDTGIGIRSDKQDLIFNRFIQVNKKVYREYGGLGLGLSIAKENIELLDGNITLKSIEGEGSVFQISIPYKPVQIKELISNKSFSELQEDCTILIAEDEEMNYLYLETLLNEEFELKCKILHARNGKEAVKICKSNSNIDMVLMDIKMPIMNGYKAAEMIKKIRPNLPVIVQTAYSTDEDRLRSKVAHCDGFISKPINKKNLNALINKYLIPEQSY